MRLTYNGTSDTRTIRSSDLPDYEGDFEDLVWTPGSSVEVPDAVGEMLLEKDKNFSSTTEEQTRDDLLSRARDLGIKGRTSMNKDELAAAISENEQALASSDQSQGTPSGAPQEP